MGAAGIDNQRIVKLLMMTTSDNDHEALVAMRKVNQLLKTNKISWQEVLEPKPNRAYVWTDDEDDRYEEIVEMIEGYLLPKFTGNPRRAKTVNFLAGVLKNVKMYERVTDKQWDAVFRMYTEETARDRGR